MLRRNWPFALVLAAGALLRMGAEVAYRPALFYSDSWGYLSMAHGHSIVTFAPLRPSGYPLILKLLHALPVITVAQHLAGLLTATLVYATCRHLNVRRWLATTGGALVALDAWAIALEQYILAEAFFSLALALAMWASLAGALRPELVDAGAIDTDVHQRTNGTGGWAGTVHMRPKASATIALSFAGLCLAAAVLMRPVGLFAVPAWIVFLLWVRPGGRAVATAILCLAVPLLIYSAAHQHSTGTFGLTQANGWFLYGRVGPIATCDGIDVERAARKLCKRPAGADDENQSFFMFNERSPAKKAFGGISGDSGKQARIDAILRHFARQVILERPGDYAKLVATDFFKYFRPGPHALHREDTTVEFPKSARIRFDDRKTRHRLYPALRTHASAPAGALRTYSKVVHTSRVLLALIVLAGLAAFVLTRNPAIFLTLGIALGILLGAALAAGFALRYLVPVVAELSVLGTLSAESLVSAARGWRVRRASPLDVREADRG